MYISSTRCSTRPACHVRVRLADGGAVILRPLRGGEIHVLETVFEGLSAQSRQQRFLVPTPRLSGSARRALADVDGRDHVAWVAMTDGEPVGICRYVRTGPETAEIAFEVVDAHQGRGIGSALVDAVTTVARANGITRLEATVDPGNRASVTMLGRLGVRLAMDDGLLEGNSAFSLLDPPSPVDRGAVRSLAAELAAELATVG
ncbi:GNAT family N-acetyltransferase [Nocardioides currus]|uniref:N-acetyltransferase domain-containing protein n=1 Tax=Nocardioides currus TaxID=2133958 RepID=A0A2R7YWF8_9ACTN|nr:GNAT family N-acetyltransferase [Nocardioides currus]PUA80644.1 hypothetical protein C7S10_12885 [Nocardioides currus]